MHTSPKVVGSRVSKCLRPLLGESMGLKTTPTPVIAIMAPRVSAVEISPWYLEGSQSMSRVHPLSCPSTSRYDLHWHNHCKNPCADASNHPAREDCLQALVKFPFDRAKPKLTHADADTASAEGAADDEDEASQLDRTLTAVFICSPGGSEASENGTGRVDAVQCCAGCQSKPLTAVFRDIPPMMFVV